MTETDMTRHETRNASSAPDSGHKGIDEARAPQADTTNHDALREATRLAGTDTYLVGADMEDIDQRQGEDEKDGRPSPMANADNPER
ncbi:hypothetical protein [Rhizobium sp. AG855]|uniref:hypothetical protein n=1 Tax=Rhizobium sp. AG855 TaxID=2183898 RepID=UPI000E751171|nr:hypothetical protein [Rhizobium sp. AG855]RKE85662.1 hypothetical protein DFO46_2463 [Rhizobium sp. AG855]